MNAKFAVYSLLIAFVLLMAGGFAVTVQADDNHKEQTFTIDVALDAATLVVNHVDPSQPPTQQLRGDTLVIDGNLYPGGTLPSGIVNNDPNAPGAIGKIRCRASVLVPLTDVTTPAATFVTELYSLPDDNQNIVAMDRAQTCSQPFNGPCSAVRGPSKAYPGSSMRRI